MYKTRKHMKSRPIRILGDCELEEERPSESVRPSVTDEDGCTSLMNASKQGDLSIVQRAILQDDINEQDEDGWTALMYASYHNHPEIVSLLIEHHANLHKKTNNGRTARWLAYTEGNVNVVSILDTHLSAKVGK